jgi:hypothetical protein
MWFFIGFNNYSLLLLFIFAILALERLHKLQNLASVVDCEAHVQTGRQSGLRKHSEPKEKLHNSTVKEFEEDLDQDVSASLEAETESGSYSLISSYFSITLPDQSISKTCKLPTDPPGHVVIPVREQLNLVYQLESSLIWQLTC